MVLLLPRPRKPLDVIVTGRRIGRDRAQQPDRGKPMRATHLQLALLPFLAASTLATAEAAERHFTFKLDAPSVADEPEYGARLQHAINIPPAI